MVCRDVLDRLSPFWDDELDPVASREIAQHLESCPSCAAACARQQQLSESLRANLEYHRAPELLRARVLSQTRAAAQPDGGARRRGAAQPWRWLSVAAAVVAVAGGTWLAASLPRAGENDAITREAVSNHIRSLMASHLEDVASTDQHTVKPWFNGKLDFSPPVADFSAAGYPLVGGRLDYLHGRTVAALVYQHRKHIINVFVWPVADAREALTPAATQQGFHVVRGTHARMAYWLVSDLNPEELAAFARTLVASPHKP
jgi:anti-sigma factor (TIGR02949 family)